MSESLPTLESVPCDFCGSYEAEPVFSGPDRLLGLPGMFTVVRCCECGLVRQNPRPSPKSIDFYYPPSYQPYSVAIDDEPSAWQRWNRRYGIHKRQRPILHHFPSGGHLLDVGCATGNFLYEMAKNKNWQVEGIEPNAEAASYAQRRLGLQVHIGKLTELDLPQASFDVITMWDVLEHLPNPLPNLKAVQKLLKPGGLFVFSIPNTESLEATLFGRYWLGWELPRHLYFFSRPVIIRMLDSVGLVHLYWRCLAGAYPSFLTSLHFALQNTTDNIFWKEALLTLAQSLPMRLLLAPIFWLLTKTNQATIITGFAHKEEL